MSAKIQLIALTINFFYGLFLFLITLINYKMIKNETILVKVLITILFVLDITFLYLIIFYKLNYGMFHLYYIFTLALGYYFGYYVKSHVKSLSIFAKLIDFLKAKL